MVKGDCRARSEVASMKVPPKRKGNRFGANSFSNEWSASMKVPPKRKGNTGYDLRHGYTPMGLNESPSQKEGKCRRVFVCAGWCWCASMKVPPKRKGNSHPKLARNDAAETGTTREPRGRPTQKVYPNQPTRTQTSVTSQNTTRATRHIYVTYQVLARAQRPPPDPLVEHPAGAFTI